MSLLQQVHRRYLDVLVRILPELPQHTVLYRYSFLWAGTHDILDPWLREDLQESFAADLSLSEMFLEDMVRFMAAGFRAG